MVKIPWKSHLKIGNPSVLPQRNCNFVSRELRGKVPFFVSSQGWAETVFKRLNILMFKRCLNAKCLNNLAEDGMMIGNV